jgi:hypothetical protein
MNMTWPPLISHFPLTNFMLWLANCEWSVCWVGGQHSLPNFQEWPANLLHEWISSLNPYSETPHCWVETITFYVHHFRFWLHGCQSPIQRKVHKDRPCSALSQTKPLASGYHNFDPWSLMYRSQKIRSRVQETDSIPILVGYPLVDNIQHTLYIYISCTHIHIYIYNMQV